MHGQQQYSTLIASGKLTGTGRVLIDNSNGPAEVAICGVVERDRYGLYRQRSEGAAHTHRT
jgi:hypothetical protein